MKFVLLSTLYPNQAQPTRALYNQRLFEAIQDAGHEVEVIAPVPSFPGKKNLPPESEVLNDIAVEHPRFFYTPGILIHHHWRFYQSAVKRTLKDLLTRSKSEELHIALGFAYPDAVAMAPICQEYGLDYSIFVLGSDFRVRTQQNKFKHHVLDCLRQAPKIFCPGQVLKTDMSNVGIEENKIVAFNNGVNQSIFYAEDPEESVMVSPKRILFVGNLVSVKAPERLLRAFAQLLKSVDTKELHLDIVGNGVERSKLVGLSRELEIEDRIQLHGRLAPELVASLMRQAACLCLCSRSEGMPNVVVEALACGCPVVATNVGEVPCLLNENVNGLVVPLQNRTETQIITDLASALGASLLHPWDRQKIAKKMSSYTWENAAQTVINEVVQ